MACLNLEVEPCHLFVVRVEGVRGLAMAMIKSSMLCGACACMCTRRALPCAYLSLPFSLPPRPHKQALARMRATKGFSLTILPPNAPSSPS